MGDTPWEYVKRATWLACLLAEVALYVCARASLARVERDPRSQGPAIAFATGLSVLLAGVVLGADPLLGPRLHALPGFRRDVMNWATWNLVATLFAVVEVAILALLLRLDGLLRDNLWRRLGPGGCRGVGVLLAGACFALYAFYLAGLLRAVDHHRVGVEGIENISAFYCRVCCGLCVLLEWLLAGLAVRAWRSCREGARGLAAASAA